MTIQIGSIVQTSRYSRPGYKGRKMRVDRIQRDIETRADLLIGRCLLKRGG